MASKEAPVSFSFSKKKEKVTLEKSSIAVKEEDNYVERDYIESVDGKSVVSKKKKEQQKELVIPLIHANRWRYAKKPEELEKDDDDDDNTEKKKDSDDNKLPADDAVKELLQEAAEHNEDWKDRGTSKDAGYAIPLLMQNKVPGGFETDDKLNVDLRPDAADEADYEAIPIEQYGMAMLRGMGWNKSKGVGKNNAKNVKPIDAVPRPKGLGLGADRSVALQAKGVQGPAKGDKDTENLTLKKGAYCVITSGKHKDLYAEVQGLDEDNCRAILKMSLSGEVITISQNALQLVSKKDYDKYSKYLNKAKADKYVEKEQKKSRTESSDSDRRRDRKQKHRSRSRSRSQSRDKDQRKKRSRSKDRERKRRSRSRSKEKKSKSKPEKSSSNGNKEYMWLRPHLRVRIVDPEYKKGKYFKSKVVIEDVVSLDSCICRTDEGKVLEDVSQSMVETVIPRSDPAYVMVTTGKYRGQLGEILRKDKATCIATVQLLSNRDCVKELDFDHICEYTGDIHAEADF